MSDEHKTCSETQGCIISDGHDSPCLDASDVISDEQHARHARAMQAYRDALVEGSPTVADLRAALACVTAERDEWKRTAEENNRDVNGLTSDVQHIAAAVFPKEEDIPAVTVTDILRGINDERDAAAEALTRARRWSRLWHRLARQCDEEGRRVFLRADEVIAKSESKAKAIGDELSLRLRQLAEVRALVSAATEFVFPDGTVVVSLDASEEPEGGPWIVCDRAGEYLRRVDRRWEWVSARSGFVTVAEALAAYRAATGSES